jgi:multidrug efflux pump subunit AcrA (membrane-fusion protein)
MMPGVCPICHMELEPMAATGHGGGSGAISSSTYLSYDIPRRRGTGPDTPAPAWVDGEGRVVALVYADEIEGLAPEMLARFYPSARPKEAVAVHVLREPVESWDRSTSRVRLDAEPPNSALRPGDVGWVRLATKARDVPVISYHAVLEGAEGPYVLVASADGRTLAKRSVAIGKVYGDMAFVLSGLGPHERVLTRSAFFVDAERRLRREATIEVTP